MQDRVRRCSGARRCCRQNLLPPKKQNTKGGILCAAQHNPSETYGWIKCRTQIKLVELYRLHVFEPSFTAPKKVNCCTEHFCHGHHKKMTHCFSSLLAPHTLYVVHRRHVSYNHCHTITLGQIVIAVPCRFQTRTDITQSHTHHRRRSPPQTTSSHVAVGVKRQAA